MFLAVNVSCPAKCRFKLQDGLIQTCGGTIHHMLVVQSGLLEAQHQFRACHMPPANLNQTFGRIDRQIAESVDADQAGYGMPNREASRAAFSGVICVRGL